MISLCMIVRNEERHITSALTSAKHLVDEMVVVDTGSTDDTIGKAKEFGAKIYSFPWRKDFSAARNFGLTKAAGSWIFVLDADERVEDHTGGKIRKSLPSVPEDGFYVPIYNYLNAWGEILHTHGLRLFRNNPQYRFRGKIHEQVLPSILELNSQAQIGWADLTIHHLGYREEEFTAQDKAKRNLEILLGQPAKNDPFYCLNLGTEYLRLKKYSEAEAHLKKGWELAKRSGASYVHWLLLRLIACLHWQGKNQEAINFCQQGLKMFPDYPDLYYYYGVCLAKHGDTAQASHVLLTGLGRGNDARNYISRAGSGSYLNLYLLGQITEQNGQFEQALDYYVQAFKLQPENGKYPRAVVRTLLTSAVSPQKYLRDKQLMTIKYLGPIIKAAFHLAGYSLVVKIAKGELDWETYLYKCRSLLLLGRYREALDCITPIPSQAPQRKDGLFIACLGAFLQQEQQRSAKYLAELQALDANLADLLDTLKDRLFGELKPEENYQRFRNNESVLALLSAIETFAARGANTFLDRALDFLNQLVGQELDVVVLQILYKHSQASFAAKMLAGLDTARLDDQEKQTVDEIKRWCKEKGERPC